MTSLRTINLTNSSGHHELPLTEWQKGQLAKANSEHGVNCLLNIWNNLSYKELVKDSFCDGVWDNSYCWPPSKSGTVLTRLCSEILHSAYPEYSANFEGKVTRVCLRNGSWAPESNLVYRECVNSLESYLIKIEDDEKLTYLVSYILFIGSLLSFLCLSGSLIIFRQYRCLRCDRVAVQTQLILSLLLRSVLMFIIAEPFVVGHQSSYRDVDILCEAVLVFFLYITFASVTWMFIQGLYLNITLMVVTANAKAERNLKIYHVIGWVVPAVFMLIYIIAMILTKPERCWLGYSKMKEMWILLGPIIFELVVNGLFLLNVLRILLKKLRNSNSRPDSSQIKAAAKATAILFPVLGLNNLMLLYIPGGEYYKYFVLLNTFFGSTQGIFVAIVYCFTNEDVLAAIRRSLQRVKARRMDVSNRTNNNDECHVESVRMVEINMAQ